MAATANTAAGVTSTDTGASAACQPGARRSASTSHAANSQPHAHPHVASHPPPPATFGVRHALAAPPLVLSIDRAAFSIASLAELSMWLSQLKSSGPAAQSIQPVAVLALTLVGLAVTLCLPHAYCRNRKWALPVIRLLVLLVPIARATKVGSALVLERQPLPGLRGLLGDLGRLTLGTRVILLAVQGVSQQLPPSAALLTQAAAALLTWNPRQYCSTQLLRAPLTAGRLAGAAAALEYATLPVLGALLPVNAGQLVWGAPDFASGDVPPEAVCIAFVSWFHTSIAVILPTLVSVWCWQPPPLATGSSPAGNSPEQGSSGILHRLRSSASTATARADCVIHSLLDTRRWATCWFLLALAWLCAKAAAGRP